MKIAFLGDIALIGKYDLTQNPNAKSALKDIAEVLKDYDFVIGNLESPLTDKESTMVCKSMHLRSPSININLLKYLNINIVSLANNHTYDFGRKGIEDTVKILTSNGIDYFGIDNKSIDINNAVIRGFVCYSTNAIGYNSTSKNKGVNTLDYKEVIKQVEEDKAAGKTSILSIHWGDEHTNYPRHEHIKFSHLLAKKNDIIISGHHPHVIQGVEKINNSLIAYSQGNFCFDDCEAISGTGMKLTQNDENRESFIFDVSIDENRIINYKTIGIKEINNQIKVASIDSKLTNLSNEIKNIKDPISYQNKRVSQFSDKDFREKKFGKKTFGWYVKRLNYYAIGAYLIGKINKYKYTKQFSKFL